MLLLLVIKIGADSLVTSLFGDLLILFGRSLLKSLVGNFCGILRNCWPLVQFLDRFTTRVILGYIAGSSNTQILNFRLTTFRKMNTEQKDSRRVTQQLSTCYYQQKGNYVPMLLLPTKTTRKRFTAWVFSITLIGNRRTTDQIYKENCLIIGCKRCNIFQNNLENTSCKEYIFARSCKEYIFARSQTIFG